MPVVFTSRCAAASFVDALKKTNVTMRMRKNPVSDAMNAHMPTTPLSNTRSFGTALFDFSFTGSHSGRRPRTGGTLSKLCGDGGDVVAHSSVHASHGLSPAGSPRR